MAIVVCTSAPGSPGVTTTALALTLAWPRHVLLADCDRAPAQSILAGYLRGMGSMGRGLPSLAQAHREGRHLDDELWLHTLPLVDGGPHERRFLPGFAQPAAVRLFDGVWSSLGEALEVLDTRGIDVVVDAGRIGAHGLPAGLLHSAALVVVITRSNLRSLASLRLHLPTLQAQLAALPVHVSLALGVVGPDRPYSHAEIARQFGVGPGIDLPFDQRAASVLLEGEPEPRRFFEQAFMGRARTVAKQLAERLGGLHEQRAEVVARV